MISTKNKNKISVKEPNHLPNTNKWQNNNFVKKLTNKAIQFTAKIAVMIMKVYLKINLKIKVKFVINKNIKNKEPLLHI